VTAIVNRVENISF